MTQPIKMFYYRSKTGIPNFGDELSRDVVEYVTGRPVVRTGRMSRELTGIGSILDRYLTVRGRLALGLRSLVSRPVYVWGSGLIAQPKGSTRHFLTPLALRGTLTRDALGADPATPLGDPGLLAARMLGQGKSRQGIGVVPHYVHKADPMIAAVARLPGVKIIDVERGGPEVCAEIASCDVILSSSLHGLVIADAYGIPNWRLGFAHDLKGGDFKFLDYASALGRTSIAAQTLTTADDALVLARRDADFSYQSRVDGLCTGLERALKSTF